MSVDSQYSQVLNVKRKLYHWVKNFLGETEDTASEHSTVKEIVPDARDIVGILNSTGFRLVDATMGQPDASPGANGLCCRVVVTCAKSGLKAVLESEADCRCSGTFGDVASAWCMLPPARSREHLDRAWSMAPNALLPNVASHVAEVVGAATGFLVQLLEDQRLVAEAAARKTSARGPAPDLLSCPYPVVTDDAGIPLPEPVWLDKLQWEEALQEAAITDPAEPEISALSLSGSQSFSRSRSDHQVAQVGVIGPPRRQSSTLEDYSEEDKPPGDSDAKVVFDNNMRLTEETRVLPSPSTALAAAAAATAIVITPTTVRAAETISTQSASTQTPENESKSRREQASMANLLPSQAQEILERAEEVVQNMSVIMEMTRMWTTSVENSVDKSLKPLGILKKQSPVCAAGPATPRPTLLPTPAARAMRARKSAPAAGSKGVTSFTDIPSNSTRSPGPRRAAVRLRPPTPHVAAAHVATARAVAAARQAAKATVAATPSQSPTAAGPPTLPARRHSLDSPSTQFSGLRAAASTGLSTATFTTATFTTANFNVAMANAAFAGRTPRRVPPSRAAPPPPPKAGRRPPHK